MTEDPFKTYEVTSLETKSIALITEQNIGQIAALVKGKVDYSDGEPVLTEPGEKMRWRVGMEVGFLGHRLTNQSGFTTGRNVINVREVHPEEAP